MVDSALSLRSATQVPGSATDDGIQSHDIVGSVRVGESLENLHVHEELQEEYVSPNESDFGIEQQTDADLEGDFAEAPTSTTSHFFVGHDGSEVTPEEEIGVLDTDIEEPQSITRFLQLPSVTTRTSGKRKDPIIEFTKSIIITSRQYVEAAAAVKDKREKDKKDKQEAKQAREDQKKRKAIEREEERARKAVQREAAQREKEERALQRAAEQARKAAEKELAQREKAVRAQAVESARLAKASEKARLAASRHDARRRRATESVEGRQTTMGIGNTGEAHNGEEADGQTHFREVSQFAPFIPQPPLAPLSHHHMPGQFFLPSSSTVSQFSHSNVHPQSTLPPLQFPTHFETPRYPFPYNWTQSRNEEDRR